MNQPFKEASISLRHHAEHRSRADQFHTTERSALRFSLRQFRSSDPGGNMATARSLGVFLGKRKIKETVGKKDKDFYQFTFGDLTDFRLKIKNRSKVNLFGDILDSQGQVVRFKGDKLSVKITAGETIENFYESLPSGTYFLRIRTRSSGKNAYQLKLSAKNTFPSLPDCGCTP